MIVLAGLVIGGIYFGFFTPTEAGAIGAAGAFVMAAARRRLGLSALREAFLGTARTTSVIFIVLVGALIFSSYLCRRWLCRRLRLHYLLDRSFW